MLSAYSQKVSELEAKLGEHEQCIRELKKTLENQGNDEEDPVKNIPKEIQRILLSFQGELKDQSFVVNRVQSKVHSFKEELNIFRQHIYENFAKQSDTEFYLNILYDLRSEVDKITGNLQQRNYAFQNSSLQQQDELRSTNGSGEAQMTADISSESIINSSLNPNVEEFKPRSLLPGGGPGMSPVSAPIQKQDYSLDPDNSNITEQYEAYSCTGDLNQGPNGGKENEKDMCTAYDIDHTEIDQFLSSSEGSPDGRQVQSDSTEKHRVILLEIELADQEQMLDKANERLATLCMSQEEELKKIDWLEYKVHLLKQDKRRRGETIGKLLKCVDDLRSWSGQVDLGRASSERAILTSSLSTRGMPIEERIQVAINVTEAEQLHQYCPDGNSPRFGSEGVEIVNGGNVDRNNLETDPLQAPTHAL